ncbi:hypothetical protein H839_08554 [Parageobacillus genomosp. 1]|uniref:Uncharacterized protein n=1 Tax=Parageobacillus genomosp. 1 TaxID=1295642 RepID=A0ABC9VGD6_9BACL|nr:hypothetical protein [Parageobacillus genomosp. 1]EZP77670.1 hypothetical protein H839_08554 [Parageobacillus genomosp. 1]
MEILEIEKVIVPYQNELLTRWKARDTFGGTGEPLLSPNDIDKAWMWSQVNTWLKEIKLTSTG